MKNKTKKLVFSKNHTIGGKKGPCHPPKNKVTIIAEINNTPRYSPIKNMPNFMLEYSVWKPAAISCSASGKSNGGREDDVDNINLGMGYKLKRWLDVGVYYKYTDTESNDPASAFDRNLVGMTVDVSL